VSRFPKSAVFDNCHACGRHWMLGDALHLSDFTAVCPHAADCNEKKAVPVPPQGQGGAVKLSAAALSAERWRRAVARITPELIANGHKFQREILECDDESLLLMCSRQCGKTEVAMGLLLLTAMRTANVSCLYLALVGPQAKKAYKRKWLPLLRRLGVPCESNTTDMSTTFPNSSVVVFGGVDDARHVASLLGDSMASGIAIVDESQSQPAVIRDLVVDVLGPMLAQTSVGKPVRGRLVISGTVPEVAAGYFWDEWAKGLDGDEIAEGRDAWRRFNWGRPDNPHLEWEAELAYDLKLHHLTLDDPLIQRNYFGKWKFDERVLAVRYNPERNSYVYTPAPWQDLVSLLPGKLRAAVPPDGVDAFAIGLDPAATADRFAIVLWGWSRNRRIGLYQVAEWVTDRAANALESQWLTVVVELKKRYGAVCRVIRDAGSAKTTNDILWRNHGIMIEAATKGPGSLRGRVDRLSDLLGTGQCKVMSGGELERDMRNTKWSKDARARGKWEFDNAWHPDVLDAATYGAVPFYESAEVPAEKPSSEESAAARDAEESLRTRFANAGQPIPKRKDASALWGRPQ
jgi:hypothetical protein